MLGYTYHALARHEDGGATFEKAYSCHITEAARLNVEGQGFIKMTDPKKTVFQRNESRNSVTPVNIGLQTKYMYNIMYK